ncbi:MAG: J domain-containing protein [Chloroflexia bacterium]|nr:J domain-containing protein [Chloroflexia bacterium]
MVFPIIGARDYIDQRGFFVNECPTCRKMSVFAVYDTKRKLTLYFVPTVNVRSQMVMECMTCHGKWGIPQKEFEFVEARLMTQLELSAYLGKQQDSRPDPPRIQQPVGRTYYQVLQVDPLADPEVVDAAFKRLALKYHPDTSADSASAANMRELLTAREILSDPARRAAYDAWLGIVRRVEATRPEDV